MAPGRVRALALVVGLVFVACAKEGHSKLVSLASAPTETPDTTEPTASPTSPSPLPLPSVLPSVSPLLTVAPRITPSSFVLGEGRSGGTRVTVTVMMPVAPLPVKWVTFRLRVQDTNGAVTGLHFTFGDGRDLPGGGVPAIGCPSPEPGHTPEPVGRTDYTRDFRHAYRYGGQYAVRVEVSTGSWPCKEAPAEDVQVSGAIHVDPDPLAPSNGPEQPILGLGGPVAGRYGQYEFETPVKADALPHDLDGYPRRLRIDWGDGSAPLNYEYPLSECKDPERTWPESPGSAKDQRTFSHAYAKPGEYRVSGVLVSSGCDGATEQRATAQSTVAIAPDGKHYKWLD